MQQTANLTTQTPSIAGRARGGGDCALVPEPRPLLLRLLEGKESSNLLQGVMLESDQERYRVRIAGRMPVIEGPKVELYGFAESGAVWRVRGVLTVVRETGADTLVEVLVTQDAGPPGHRQTYRVCVAALNMWAELANAGSARVLDVSVEGLSVINRLPLPVGKPVGVRLMFAKNLIAGRMIARNCVARPDGHHQIGLEAPAEDTRLRKGLQALTMGIQRAQLRRRADRELAAGDSSPEQDGTIAPPVAALLEAQRLAARGAPDRRAHPRLPWKSELMLDLVERGSARTVRVTTIDVSCGGFAFCSRAYVHAGTKVRSVLSIHSEPRPVVGVVRHVELVNGFVHRVGVRFVDGDDPVPPEDRETKEQTDAAPNSPGTSPST